MKREDHAGAGGLSCPGHWVRPEAHTHPDASSLGVASFSALLPPLRAPGIHSVEVKSYASAPPQTLTPGPLLPAWTLFLLGPLLPPATNLCSALSPRSLQAELGPRGSCAEITEQL